MLDNGRYLLMRANRGSSRNGFGTSRADPLVLLDVVTGDRTVLLTVENELINSYFMWPED